MDRVFFTYYLRDLSLIPEPLSAAFFNFIKWAMLTMPNLKVYITKIGWSHVPSLYIEGKGQD